MAADLVLHHTGSDRESPLIAVANCPLIAHQRGIDLGRPSPRRSGNPAGGTGARVRLGVLACADGETLTDSFARAGSG